MGSFEQGVLNLSPIFVSVHCVLEEYFCYPEMKEYLRYLNVCILVYYHIGFMKKLVIIEKREKVVGFIAT